MKNLKYYPVRDIENLKELLTNEYSGDKSKLITSRCKREKTTEPVRYWWEEFRTRNNQSTPGLRPIWWWFSEINV